MPQLDLFSIFNQFFWGCIFFAIFYYYNAFYFIPSFFASLHARKSFSEGRSLEIFSLLGSTLIAHVFISAFFESMFDSLTGFFDYLIYSRALNGAVYESSFDLEFSSILEEADFDN